MDLVLERGRMLQVDAALGWRPLPDLDLRRKNADGRRWTIATNHLGFRSAEGFGPAPRCRLLVLGDSFAFGEGVERSERFDELLARSRGCATVNLGVPGFGTDQELLAAAGFLPGLTRGDALVLLTYANDFVDILRRRFAGRAKPWYELTPEGPLRLHPAALTVWDRWGDRSYLWARTAALLEPTSAGTLTDPLFRERALRLYGALVAAHLAALPPRGVHVLIAYHGLDRLVSASAGRELRAGVEAVCAREGIACLDLDVRLDRTRSPSSFLRDGHWTREGHARVASALDGALPPTPHAQSGR